jgi:DNA-binding LacI/PurR family transcriptional regulator
MPSREESFWYQIMDGLHDALGSGTPYQLIYSYSGDDANKISSLLTEAYLSEVAGVVLLALYEVDRVELFSKGELPKSTVLVHNCHPDFKGTFVGTKEEEVIEDLFEKMKAVGVRDFHFFSGSHCSSHQQRKEAFIDCIESEGLDLHVYQVGTSEEDGYRFAKEKWIDAIQLSDTPSGLFCINDHVALGVSKALKEAKIQVGKKVLLAGFGNVLRPNSSLAAPWTTVEQKPYELGKAAMNALLSELEGRSKAGRKILLPGEVISQD